VGAAILGLALANIVALLGWGDYWPWSVPGLYAGYAGDQAARLPAASYLIVVLTGVAGVAATHLWWKWADHSR
jgi:ABC-2 type transport system permease protein